MAQKLTTLFLLAAATGWSAEATNLPPSASTNAAIPAITNVPPTATAASPAATNPATAGELDALLKQQLQNAAGIRPPQTSSNTTASTARETLTNDNLLPSPSAALTQAAQQRLFQEQLDQARQLRQQNAGILAARQLVRLLESDAPEDIKQPALYELALVAQQENQPARAQQIFAQYLHRYPDDALAPEILLRQGLLYREMGLNNLALAKFYAVLSNALSLKTDRLDYYQRLVLQAQTEIADTYYLEGKYDSSIEYLGRLLKLDHPQLNKARIQFKLIRSLSALRRHPETTAQALDFLKRHAGEEGEPEVRFLLADALKQAGRNEEAVEQVRTLLESQAAKAASQPETWLYWQQRAGNDIANQLYKEGDYLNAVTLYQRLERLNPEPQWRCPVLYQIGLVYEQLKQPEQAAAAYREILALAKGQTAATPPGLQMIFDMAQWRLQFLRWREQTEQALPAAPPSRAASLQTTNHPSQTPASS